jgi:tripartite ATP-independent transporter DctP family solute receptor
MNKSSKKEDFMKSHKGIYLSVVFCAIVLMVVSSAVAAPKVIKLGHFSGANITLPGQGLVPNSLVMKDYIEGASGGSLQVEIHPNAALGSVRPMIELTQAGAIQMTIPYTSIMVPFVPEMGITQIPFLFNDNLAAIRTMQGPIGDELANLWLKKTGIRILSWPEGSGFRQLYTKSKMVKTPDDLKGLKIRVPENPGLLALFTALGAKTVTVTWTETYTALQTGIADGCETELSSADDAKLFEVMRYGTILNHAWNLQPVLINEKFFQSLTPQEKMIVMRAAEIGELAHNGFNRAVENVVIQKNTKAGVKFYYPNEKEMDQFKKIGQKAYLDTLAKSVSKEWIDKSFKAVAKVEEDMAKEYQSKMK